MTKAGAVQCSCGVCVCSGEWQFLGGQEEAGGGRRRRRVSSLPQESHEQSQWARLAIRSATGGGWRAKSAEGRGQNMHGKRTGGLVKKGIGGYLLAGGKSEGSTPWLSQWRHRGPQCWWV